MMDRLPALPVILFLILAALPGTGSAQAGGPIWSNPQNISNMPSNSAYPQVVSGPDGVVHVFWTENLSEYSPFNNVIYYARLDAMGWSQPVDILASPQGLEVMADYPTPLLGSDGRLHLVFTGGWGGQIYYSSADAANALDAHAWSVPLLLSEDITGMGYPNILEDAQGHLHVVFQCERGAHQGLYQTQSTDGGISWSQMTLIPGTPLSMDTVLADTRAAISARGVLHVAWMWTSVELFPPKGIYYVQSTDLGATWSDIESVMEGPYRYPDVAISGDQTAVMTWSGTAEDRFKYYRWSGDGGLSWSEPVRISTLGGFQGYSGMAVDSQGGLHLGMVASCFGIPNNGDVFSGDALIYSTWKGASFSTAEALLANNIRENNLQFADISISEGNIAHLVAMYPVHASEGSTEGQSAQPYQFEIYYVQGMLDAPHLPAPETTPVVQAVPTQESAEEVLAISATEGVLPASAGGSPVQSGSHTAITELTPTISILIGSIPALFILIVLLAVRSWNRGR